MFSMYNHYVSNAREVITVPYAVLWVDFYLDHKKLDFIQSYCIVLYYIISYYILLYCIVSYCAVLCEP